MRFLVFLFVLLCGAQLFAQTDSVQIAADSSARRPAFVRLCGLNKGRPVNGIQFSFGFTDGRSPARNYYRVNGLDLSVFGYEHTINGIAFSLLYSEVDYMNGVHTTLLVSDAGGLNGIGITGLLSLYMYPTNGFVFTGLGNTATRHRGVCVAGVWSTYDENVSGVLVSGLFNHVYGRVGGISLTAGVNHYEASAYGVSVAGLWTKTEDDAAGVIASGLVNNVQGDVHGLYFSSLVNYVGGEAHGVMLSAVNRTSVMQGVQVGVINSTRRLQGVQFGLINVNKANPKWCRVLPLINFNFRTIEERDTLWQNGRADYAVKTYYNDGVLASVKQFRSGAQHGEQVYYNTFGDKVSVVPYSNGKRDGTENRYDGSGNILETVHWNNDSAVRTAVYAYPLNGSTALRELTVTENGKKHTAILFLTDTLYSFADENGGMRAEQIDEAGAVVVLRSGDSTLAIYWLPSDKHGSFTASRFNSLYPATVDSVYLDAWTDADAIADFVQVMNSALPRVRSNDTLVVSVPTSDGCTLYRTYCCDSAGNRYRKIYTEVKFRNGVTQMSFDRCGEKTYYANGQLKTEVAYDCNSHRKNSDRLFNRRCYYDDGTLAVYDSAHIHRFYYDNGKLQREHAKDKSYAFYSNGVAEYTVSADSMIYNDRNGKVKMIGVRDTLYCFGKSGRVEKRMELLGLDTVVVTTYSNNKSRSDTLDASDVFKKTKYGRRCLRIIRDEPVPPHIAADCYDCEEGPRFDTAAWFGISFTYYMNDGNYHRWWTYNEPEEFLPTDHPW